MTLFTLICLLALALIGAAVHVFRQYCQNECVLEDMREEYLKLTPFESYRFRIDQEAIIERSVCPEVFCLCVLRTIHRQRNAVVNHLRMRNNLPLR